MPETEQRNLSSLKSAAHNPAGRTEEKRLAKLLKSIRTRGMLYPILVDSTNTIIDGHRRLAVAKKLGWKKVEVKVVTGDLDSIYSEVNDTPAKMSGHDVLEVWLKNPLAVPHRTNIAINAAAAVIGRDMLSFLCRKGLSLRVYKTAVQIARYCDDTSPVFIVRIVRWLAQFEQIGQVMKAIEMGQPARVIAQAVKANKRIKFSIGVAA